MPTKKPTIAKQKESTYSGVGILETELHGALYFEKFKIHKFRFKHILKKITHVCKDVKCMCEKFQDEIP